MIKPIKPPIERIIKSGLISKPMSPGKVSHKSGKLIFFSEWCKKCGLCAEICPHHALSINESGNPELADQEKCRLCSLCWRICPDFAIVKNPDIEEKSDG